jgi:hypothetical protein
MPQLPALRPLRIQTPDIGRAISEREAEEQRSSVLRSNLRGAELGQQFTQQKMRLSREQADIQEINFINQALSRVNNQESFDFTKEMLARAFPGPEDIERLEAISEQVAPGGILDMKAFDKARSAFSAKAPATFSKKNPDGSVRTIKNVMPGSEQAMKLQAQGFVRGTQTVGVKPSPEERKEARLIKNVDKLSGMAATDPNKFFEEQNFRQNPDGSLFLDPVSEAPQRLKPFYTATGKRGNIKAMISLGEMWDDSKELSELMELPSVKKNLQQANSDGLWDQATGKWSNAIKKWMQNRGIGGDSPTATAIARIQRMGSEERRSFAGTAVTQTELESILAWLPSAGDSYEQIINKTRLMGQEAEQAFRRQMDIFGEESDMSPFYKAFGINRFPTGEEKTQQEADDIINKYLGQGQ